MMWLIVSASCCILFLLRLMWSRRRFYYLSSKLNGPYGLPLIGNALDFFINSKDLNAVLKLSRTYGSPTSFWIGEHFFVNFDRPEDIEAVLKSPASIDKGHLYKLVKRMLGGDNLLTSRGETWKLHRKLLRPPIQNYNYLNSFYPSYNKNVRVMVDLLENKVGKGSFDINHCMEACTLDIVFETTFGVYSNVQAAFKPWYGFYPLYRLSKYYQIGEKSRHEARLFIKKILDKKIKEFESQNLNEAAQNESNGFENFVKKPVKTFIDELIRLSMEEKYFSEEEMISEGIMLMLAGFETTALTVSYIVLMLALHSEYQEKVFQELRDIFPEQRSDVTAEDIAKFQYTEQFINESMRYAPTVPILLRSLNKDMKIGEHTIPSGTELAMSVLSLHRNPIVWGEKADVFDPDHFLPEACKKRHPYAFIPFSAGLRNCIGLKFGKITVRIFVAWLVRNYRFTTDLKIDELSFRFHMTMRLAQGHMVHIHKRENY